MTGVILMALRQPVGVSPNFFETEDRSSRRPRMARRSGERIEA